MALAHFLDYSYWEKAAELEELKISLKGKNQHFNTLNIHYYSRLNEPYRLKVAQKDYFENKVKNNVFYDLFEEFFISFYAKAKNIYGIRNYAFISYSLGLVHNAIGLYLLQLSDEYRNNYHSKINTIHSFYGGNIKYEKNNISFTKKNIYYRNEYLNFRKVLVQNTKSVKSIAIRIDIENYFDNLHVDKLLNFLKTVSKPNVIKEFIFDETTIKEIQQFYRFVMKDRTGIPQIDNGIISNFMGHLYLTFIDLEIDSFMKLKKYKNFKIIRYMDDMYLIFEPMDELTKSNAKKEAIDILGRIKDLIYNKYSLKINNKTNVYFLKDDEERQKFFRDSKNHSAIKFLDISIDTKDDKNDSDDPNTIINSIFRELQKTKDEGVEIELGTNEIEQHTLLKIFDNRVKQLLNKTDNKKQLESIFEDFNFDFMKVSPLVLTILATINDSTKKEYKDFLLNKKVITSNDRELILEMLKQENFKDKSLVEKLKMDRYFNHILDLLGSNDIKHKHPSYFGLSFEQLQMVIGDNVRAIKQMELRVMNELSSDYSVALNHLVNEFQAICYSLDNSNKGNYDANSAISFLQKKKVNHNQSLLIRNMFDRRNNNLISHAGEGREEGAAVTHKEYVKYKKAVGECLKFLT